MELLAPAGDMAAFCAAMACGADAVYLGYTAFGARSYAGNFGDRELCEAVAAAHDLGRKIYVTVNTLVRDGELDELRRALRVIDGSGADALIVQDAGVVRIAQREFPRLALHASTQMTVNNAQGAALLRDLGFARVVPARECTLAELRRIADTGVDVEAFAHGALCVSVSGQCLFSAMIGGRSGNRGKCAQPCRMAYRLDCGQSGYLLSTRDLMLLRRLPELLRAGVASVKLEGRMKRPGYVAVVRAAYRRALDALAAGEAYEPDEAELEGLRQIFNRGGFTQGYVMGENHAALMSWEKPNHWGVSVGAVESVRRNKAVLRTSRALHTGDQLQLRGRGERDFIYTGAPAEAGAAVPLALAREDEARPGDEVFRLTDEEQMRTVRARVQEGPARVPVHAGLRVFAGERPVLKLWDDCGHLVRTEGEKAAEPAKNRALDEAGARAQLSRLGDTAYTLASFAFEGRGDAFVPLGELNALRRRATDELRRQRLAPRGEAAPRIAAGPAFPEPCRSLLVSSLGLEDAKEAAACGADRFIWQIPTLLTDELEEIWRRADPGFPVGLELPAVTYTEELEALRLWVRSHPERFCCVILQNVGQAACGWGCETWGGQGLNLFNRESAAFFTALGLRRLTASCELSLQELRTLARGGGDFILAVSGRAQLMTLSHCPLRTMRGGTRTGACGACDGKRGWIERYTDQKGYAFPAGRLKSREGCRLQLYNSVPLDASRLAQRLEGLPCSFRLSFTDESGEEKRRLTASWRNWMETGTFLHEPDPASTGGRLQKGVL